MGWNVDYLIVGSGLTGATIARLLADAGREALVVERRAHIGGNVHDELHPSGIRVHTYGPHYFRTNSDAVWNFANRFDVLYRYEAIVKTLVDGQYENWPITSNYIRRVIGENWEPSSRGEPQNFEEACLAMMPRVVYDKFVKGYTEKQWGVPTHRLTPHLVKRFEIRSDEDPRLSRHKYQGIPSHGYAVWMQNMLAGIPVLLNTDYLQQRHAFRAKQLIFTGPIDEFFGFDWGRLQYRGQQRELVYLPTVEYALPCGQLNNPDPANGAHVRTIEWKHMMPPDLKQNARGTVLTREMPISPTDPNSYEYPFPDRANAELYERYRQRAQSIPNLTICGRLGEYRYYDMDQAIGRAMMLARRLLESRAVRASVVATPA